MSPRPLPPPPLTVLRRRVQHHGTQHIHCRRRAGHEHVGRRTVQAAVVGGVAVLLAPPHEVTAVVAVGGVVAVQVGWGAAAAGEAVAVDLAAGVRRAVEGEVDVHVEGAGEALGAGGDQGRGGGGNAGGHGGNRSQWGLSEVAERNRSSQVLLLTPAHAV